MIGIVIVSHSSLIADGTKELALQMADPTLKIMSIPLHAGTVQYLTEIGVDVPEELIPEEYI